KVVLFVIVVLGLLALAFWLLRRSGGGRLGDDATRGRQPRLAVIDQATVDSRRRLVLIRRDNVEHLLIIGGSAGGGVERNTRCAAGGGRKPPGARHRRRGKRSRPVGPPCHGSPSARIARGRSSPNRRLRVLRRRARRARRTRWLS